jgi:hypothetical protein
VLVGLATVLLGCPVAVVVRMIWASRNSQVQAISFSPMGLAEHLAHSFSFWALVIVLFTAGFIPSVLLQRRRMLLQP